MRVYELRRTELRVRALLYASGRGSTMPSPGVARRLQKAGLIRWAGPLYRPFRGQAGTIEGPLWRTTRQGDEMLMRWTVDVAP